MPRPTVHVTLRELTSWLLDVPKQPRIVHKDNDVVVAYKPPGVHTVNVASKENPTLTQWFYTTHPEVMEVKGRSPGDGGVLHRLDGGTSGLILAARNQAAFDALSSGHPFLKHYTAICSFDYQTRRGPTVPVWPLSVDSRPDRWYQRLSKLPVGERLEDGYSFDIVSKFTPFGPRGARVRPVDVVEERFYDSQTDLLELGYHSHCQIIKKLDPRTLAFRVSLKKGFRHQVRAHLAYIGCPVIGDPLYPIPPPPQGNLVPDQDTLLQSIGLYATSIEFVHPSTKQGMKITLDDPCLSDLL